MANLRPYLLHGYLLIYTPLLLLADSRTTTLWEQYGLGLLTFACLLGCLRYVAGGLRVQVLLCVGVATMFEIFGSLIWGVYHYRFHNIPLYVPPGHGLVYLFGITAGSLPIFQTRPRQAAWAILAAATLWAVAGLTVLPLINGRIDVQGAALLPIFAWFVLRSPRYILFAAIFVATGELEIFGTSLGTWAWVPVAPWTHVPQGNPPSVIAGGYCVIDASVLGVLWLAHRATSALRPAAAPAEVLEAA